MTNFSRKPRQNGHCSGPFYFGSRLVFLTMAAYQPASRVPSPKERPCLTRACSPVSFFSFFPWISVKGAGEPSPDPQFIKIHQSGDSMYSVMLLGAVRSRLHVCVYIQTYVSSLPYIRTSYMYVISSSLKPDARRSVWDCRLQHRRQLQRAGNSQVPTVCTE